MVLSVLWGKTYFKHFLFSIVVISFLSACASSDVSREAASNMDMGVSNAKSLGDRISDSDIGDAYQNASQATKGAIIGGTAGAATGALVSGIGVIPGTATGLILGASYGSYIDSKTTLEDKLQNRGVNIVVLGDQILIVIPSARLFDYMTANVRPHAYSTLNMVAQYINQFTKMMVKVGGYTDNTGASTTDVTLSREQAEKVARILTASGIDARVLYAEGYGSSHLVQRSDMNWDSDNYRIEITLEKLYV